jgi:hypothetical protein
MDAPENQYRYHDRHASERFEDTSFGIALNALRQAKETWKKNGRVVNMTALLVEQNTAAHARLAILQSNYLDITIKTYLADFLSIVPSILKDIPNDARAFNGRSRARIKKTCHTGQPTNRNGPTASDRFRSTRPMRSGRMRRVNFIGTASPSKSDGHLI